MKKNAAKRALLMSVISLMLCVSMLVGTTFAWFTDSVTSANNIIKSGNLDIELEYWDGDSWEDVKEQSDILTNTLWEPGVTEIAYLRVANAGTLALKYQLGINILSETAGVNQAGAPFNLSDHILFGVVENINGETNAYASREDAVADLTDEKALNAGYTKASSMTAGQELYLALVVYMPTTVDNVANHNGINVPKIDLGINAVATQLMSEDDSFGPDYDEDAWVEGFKVYNAQDLQAAIDNGETAIQLEDDVVLPADGIIIVPEGTTLKLNLNGKDLNATNESSEYAIANMGELELLDTQDSGAATASSRMVKARGVYNGYNPKTGETNPNAKLTIHSGSFYAMGTNGGAAVFNYGKLIVKGGYFESNGGYGINNQPGGVVTLNNASVTGGVYNQGALTINNSTVYQHLSGKHAIYNWTGNVVINSGNFDSVSGNELILVDGSNASVEINGGTFKKTAKSWLFGAATGKNITFTINGGNFSGYVNLPENTVDPIRGYGDPITVYGGTFNFDPINWVAEGYNVTENADGTYTVSRTPLSFADFLTKLEAGNYEYDGTGVTVVLKDSEFNYFNGVARQFYIPASTVNINSDVENIKIKNVNFVFEDDDTANTYTTGELQTLAKNVTFEGCTFDNVSVSPWEAHTGANDCASATFTKCTWKNLTGRYAVHQSKAAALTVTDCTINSLRGIHVNTVNELNATNNTFNGIGDNYGVLCLSEGITVKPATINVSGNIANDQTMLRQLSNAVTYDQVCSIFANNTYGEGKEYVSGSIILKDPSFTYLTAENYASTTLVSNTKYALEGDFGGNNVALTMAVGVENVTFDGSNATNINELIITQNGALIDNANTPKGNRSGNVTVQNFNVLSQINVFACKTEVVVQNNTAEALMIHAGNCAVKVLNNNIDANFKSHPTYRSESGIWNTNNYGIALNIFDYNLWFEGNTVTDATGHAVGLNGWEGTIDNGDENVIESFKDNTITVNSTSNTKRAAFKVWDDETYASNDEDTNVVNATAQAFINAVLADGSNTFNIVDGYEHTIFCFYNVNTNS